LLLTGKPFGFMALLGVLALGGELIKGQIGRCLVREALARRREVLAEMCHRLDVADVQFSAGVIGAGKALYEAAITRGHEGVMAKHLAATYRPGRRSAAWRKIKPRPIRTYSAREIAS